MKGPNLGQKCRGQSFFSQVTLNQLAAELSNSQQAAISVTSIVNSRISLAGSYRLVRAHKIEAPIRLDLPPDAPVASIRLGPRRESGCTL